MLELLWRKIQGAWKSLTVWANAAFANLILFAEPLKEYVPQVQPYLTGDNFKTLFLVVIALNVALRFKTTKSLAEK